MIPPLSTSFGQVDVLTSYQKVNYWNRVRRTSRHRIFTPLDKITKTVVISTWCSYNEEPVTAFLSIASDTRLQLSWNGDTSVVISKVGNNMRQSRILSYPHTVQTGSKRKCVFIYEYIPGMVPCWTVCPDSSLAVLELCGCSWLNFASTSCP
jgi:hypothetical protein